MTTQSIGHWQKPLSSPIPLLDGTVLSTLAEGAGLLTRRFNDERDRSDLTATFLTIRIAALTGNPDEIYGATLLLDLLLSREGLK